MLGPCNKGALFQLRWPYTSRVLTELEQTVFDAGGGLPLGVGLDPTLVALDYQQPGLAVSTVEYPGGGIVREATGIYHYELDTTPAAGSWWIRAYSTGTGQAAVEDYLQVIANFAGPEV